MMLACELSAATSLAECGGKAFHLKQMLDRRIPVPPGFVVTNQAFQTFLNSNQLRALIHHHLRSIDLQNPESCQVASTAIQNFVLNGFVPNIVRNEVAFQLKKFQAAGKLVVRSSAVGEDSSHAAFAGQLDSILHVDHSLTAVCQALKACWASYWSARVLFYQRARNVFLDGMGVLIQEQVESVLSGVLFTQRPATPSVPDDPESIDLMLVEFCEGLGDQLVAGRMTPGRIVISRRNRAVTLETWPEGTFSRPPLESLCVQHMPRLAGYGLELEAAFGAPQDIEWTISEDSRLLLVQSRPITTVAVALRGRIEANHVSDSHSTASVETNPRRSDSSSNTTEAPRTDTAVASHRNRNNSVWSNANVNENFPDPICPLLYSIAEMGYYHYFRNLGRAFGISNRRIAAMEIPLRNIVGVHSGRLYYHLSNIHKVLRMAPFGEMLTESFNLFVGSGQTERDSAKHTWTGFARGWLGQICELMIIAFKTSWTFWSISRRISRFERTIDEFAARTQPDALAERGLPDLLEDLRDFQTIRCHRWVDAALADAAAMLSYSLLKRFLNREFPASDASTLHNSLLKGLSGVVSGKPMVELWNLSRQIQNDIELRSLFTNKSNDSANSVAMSSMEVLEQIRCRPQFESFRIELDRFLGCWGFRCSGELMLTVPSFQERPEALVDILRSYSELENGSPQELLERQNAERILATDQVLRQLSKRCLFKFIPWPRKSFLARRLLKWTQQSIMYRERVRLKQALLYSRCRRITLAIGSRLTERQIVSQAEDAFFLTIQELESLLSGSSMFPYQVRDLVTLRRKAHAEFADQRPPDTFSLPCGEYWTPLSNTAAAPECTVASEQGVLTGVGVCGGLATARAAVLKDVTEQGQLSVGDILVTRQTDPGWGPVFMLIRGLVMERGGMLSHGAILAREYGLPTVVGIPDATRRIQSGNTITVDGDRGHVELT